MDSSAQQQMRVQQQECRQPLQEGCAVYSRLRQLLLD